MTTFTTDDRINSEEEIGIPFVGWVKLNDKDDEVQMLRHQIRIQQNEIHRLMTLLTENGVKYD